MADDGGRPTLAGERVAAFAVPAGPCRRQGVQFIPARASGGFAAAQLVRTTMRRNRWPAPDTRPHEEAS